MCEYMEANIEKFWHIKSEERTTSLRLDNLNNIPLERGVKPKDIKIILLPPLPVQIKTVVGPCLR